LEGRRQKAGDGIQETEIRIPRMTGIDFDERRAVRRMKFETGSSINGEM
jgi:hypothetical protein